MRKFMVSCMGIFLMTWGLSTDVFASDLNHSKRFKIGNILLANASPQNYEDSVDEEIKIGMLVDKVATPSGEFYDVQFYAEGEPLENVKTIRIKTPESKNILLKNPVGLSYLEVEAYNMGIDDLEKRFPEGKYQVNLSPRKYGKATTFDMEYDFPAPETANEIEFAFSSEKRSKRIKLLLWRLMPKRIPLFEVRSNDTNGNVEEMGEEFKYVWMRSLSVARGRVELKPSSC